MNIDPIATIHTPFSEKFTIPRQAAIVDAAVGRLQFSTAYRHPDALNGLSEHSHYWLIWGFHSHFDKDAALTVRPPRLGGNRRVGVFATRSPFRPNPLGLSVVKLQAIHAEDFCVDFSGVDMLDGSPIYDIKPYIPYADHRPDAQSDWAEKAPAPHFQVTFLPEVAEALKAYDRTHHHSSNLYDLVTQLLTYDARPAYKDKKINDDKLYKVRLYDVDIAWRLIDERVCVVEARQCP